MTHRRCLIGIGIATLILAAIAPSLSADSSGLSSESAREKKIRQALQSKMDYRFDAASLTEVVEFLEEQHEIDIHIDQRELVNEGLSSAQIEISTKMRGVRLDSFLNVVLAPEDLDWHIENDVLMITTRQYVLQNPRSRVYQVRKIAEAPAESEQLAELLQKLCSNAATSEKNIHSIGGRILVTGSERTHRLTEDLLELLAAEPSKIEGVDANKRVRISKRLGVLDNERITAALKEETSFDFDETPLSAVLSQLATRHMIPIIQDRQNLAALGVSDDTPITKKVRNVSLRSGLNLLLKDVGLAWSIENECLKISTPDSITRAPVAKVYFVGSLFDRSSAMRFVEMCRAVLKRDTADAENDRSVVTMYRDVFVIRCTEKQHQRIAQIIHGFENPTTIGK